MKKLVLILLVFVSSCFVLQKSVFAINGSLFISEVKLGGAVSGQPTEFVELFNDTDNQIDLSEYMLEYAKSTSTLTTENCTGEPWDSFDQTSAVKIFTLNGIIQPRGRTVHQITLNDGVDGSLRIIKTSTVDTPLSVVDLLGWGATSICQEAEAATMPPNGTSIKRLFSSDGHPIDTDNNKNDFTQPVAPLPESDPPIIEETQPEETNTCSSSIVLSEFLTDPEGLEADGGEFIELYNSGATEASLLGCQLNSSKINNLKIFSSEDKVSAGGYFVINLADKLTNSNGSITFITNTNEQVVNYSLLKEGETFALIDNSWKITDVATPGTINKLVLLSEEEVAGTQNNEAGLAPCPEGKYRNTATNRCRNIELASSELEACDAGEYRSTETNRCRKVTLATASLLPCDIGEERNPATNRCRKISSITSDLKPCDEGSERNEETNRCRKIASIVGSNNQQLDSNEDNGSSSVDLRIILVVLALASGYGVYEYKTDIKNIYERVVNKLLKGRSL